MNGKLVREQASDLAENPYLKLLARVAMVFVTFVAAPVTYWVVTTMLDVSGKLGIIVTVQTTQQQQLQTVLQTQGLIISTQATEAQTRAVTDAQLEQQVKGLKESQDRTEQQIERQNDRLEGIVRQYNKDGR